MTRYLQGKYEVKNKEKYAGNVNNVKFRSSWERKTMLFFDNNPGILKWNSEETIINYISPVDNKQHRYFVDFSVLYKTKSGEVKKALVEVKPKSQTVEPKKRKNTKRYLTEVTTFLVNQAKWEYARNWCIKNGWDFIILDETHINV